MSLMATRCLLGKRKTRSKNHEECLLDPEYDRSHGKPGKGRGKQLVKTIASMFGFGRKKKGEEVERIGYEVIEKNEEDFGKNEEEFGRIQWVRFGEEEEGKKKRPRLEELLGWNLKLEEKDDQM